MFVEVRADRTGIHDWVPRERWRDYVDAVLPHEGDELEKGHSERKTGLYVPNGETTRLIRDERGWLRLAS